jgi:hypothetical protein
MKSYPSISRIIPDEIIQWDLPIFAFSKIDGSNIRAEFNTKQGFYKFGTRTRLLGSDQGILTKADELIRKQESKIANICQANKWKSIILFYEFAGPNSFAGSHVETDDHQVYLIDANPYKKGIVSPEEFINVFGELNPAPCLYHGKYNREFRESVENGTLSGISSEGVVCKAKERNTLLMFKIKQDSWYVRLKEYCGEDRNKFMELK